MNHTPQGFTLLEMVIVIVVIGILAAVTLNVNWNVMPDLQTTIDQQDYINNYQSHRSKNQTTNRHFNQPYTQLTLSLSGNTFSYHYNTASGHSETTQYPDLQVHDIIINETPASALDLQLQPLKLGCVAMGSPADDRNISSSHRGANRPIIDRLIIAQTGLIHFTLSSERSPKSFCYQIDLASCLIQGHPRTTNKVNGTQTCLYSLNP